MKPKVVFVALHKAGFIAKVTVHGITPYMARWYRSREQMAYDAYKLDLALAVAVTCQQIAIPTTAIMEPIEVLEGEQVTLGGIILPGGK